MKKINFFVTILIISLIGLIALFIFMVYTYPSSTYPDWMSEMWNHMGGGMMGETNDPYLGYFGVLFAVLIVVLIIAFIGIFYFIINPQQKKNLIETQLVSIADIKKSEAIESIRRTLTKDEQKILSILEKHNGKYLQKYLGKEAGLSRLKTHRILTRFVERDIVTLEKKGNTNEVKLKEWIIK